MGRRLRRSAPRAAPDARTRGDPAYAGFRFRDSPFYLIARTNGRYSHDMERELRPIGMDIPRWRALMVVREHDPSSVSEIAELAVMRLSTMTRVVQRLQRQGLVRLSVRKTDARSTEVSLTTKGRRAVARVREHASRIYSAGFRDFSSKEITMLNSLVARVFRNLKLD
jgi:DNA-binding MarR family transcriptional regulator